MPKVKSVNLISAKDFQSIPADRSHIWRFKKDNLVIVLVCRKGNGWYWLENHFRVHKLVEDDWFDFSAFLWNMIIDASQSFICFDQYLKEPINNTASKSYGRLKEPLLKIHSSSELKSQWWQFCICSFEVRTPLLMKHLLTTQFRLFQIT